MGVFDWFRGAFGGDTEEEKRRKRQQQQAQTPKPQVQVAQPQQPSLSVSSTPNRQPTIDVPKPQKVTQPAQLFQTQQTPKPPKTNLFDKISAFSDTFSDKLGGGLGRAFLRGTDYLLPGKNTFGLEGFANEWDKRAQASAAAEKDQAAAQAGKIAGSVAKGIVDVATIALPQSKIDELVKAGSVYKTLQDGSKLVKYGSKFARVIPGSVAGTVINNVQQVGQGNKPDWAKSTAIGTATDVATEGLLPGAKYLRRFFNKPGLLNDIAKETNPSVLKNIFGMSDEAATVLAQQTDPEGVKQTLQRLAIDPSFKLPDDIQKRLQDEGITAVRRDPNAQYPAEYSNREITARDQQALDKNIYHEIAHSQWENDLTPEEKALFKGQGAASQEAVGRAGYNQADVNSEDFADYMNKAMNGRFNEVPQEFQAVIAKYAKIALTDPQLARNTLKQVVANQSADLSRYLKNNPQLTEQQIQEAIDLSKRQSLDLVNRLEAGRANAVRAIDKQIAENAVQTTDLARQAQEAQAVRQAQNTPAPVPGVKTSPEQPVSPEMAANSGYQPTTEELLYGNAPQFQEKGRLSIPQMFSPDRIIRENITNPAEALVQRGIQAAQTSSFAPARGLGRFFTGFSREAGVTPELQTARMQLRGGVETGKLNREAVANLGSGFSEDSKTRIWATLDPEFAARMGKTVDNLTPEETVVRDNLKTIIDNTTAENLRRGLVTPEQAANESYIKRAYTVYDGNPDADKFERGFRTELLNQYKGRKAVSNDMVEKAITDPTYLVGKKTAESQAMWAMQDYGNFLVKNGNVSDVARPGFTQLPDSPVFGEAAGKFVPRNLAEDFTGFQYNNAMVSAFNDLITAYDRLGIRQAKKQILTIFNPAVRLGNQTTNRGIFANLGGINPVQFNVVYAQVGKMMKENNQLYREAVSQGLTGIDITQADFYAKRIAAAANGDKNIFRKALDFAQNSYSGADDKARVTAYVIKRNQGYSPEEAARQVQRSFQDYKSVGFFYDMAAKTPLIGNAFVRFAADSIRIAKNAALDHPLRAIGTIGAWVAFTNAMSSMSGESPEDRKARENRFGAPKLPFTDISLAVQTPFGEVNVARFMPWYSLNEIGGDAKKLLPIGQSPVDIKDGKVALNGGGFQDPLLGQLVQLAADKDFRNKSIRDPNSTADKYALDPLSNSDQLKNVGRFLFTQNVPLGREIDATASAAKGQEDVYGKTRSLPQALLRDFGVKIEQYGNKQVKDQQATQAYFDQLDQINKELQDMTPSEQEAWKRLSGYYKLHEQVPNEFKPGTTRDKKAAVYNFGEDKWKDYASNPRLYDLMVQKKQQDKARSGTPIQPEFDERLSASFRKQLLQNKMVAPGDDAELDQRMYSSPEWDYYMKLKDQYKADAAKYYGQGDGNYTDELVKHQDAKFPDKPAAYKAYTAAYALYADGKGDKPEFTDAVKNAKAQYDKATFDWTNKERQARGLPAITADMWNNPTFGYDSTPSGFGFGGSNYNPADHINTLAELTNFSNDVSGDQLRKVEAANMPNLVALFQKLYAGGGGGRSKPKLGAGSRGM